MADGLARQHKVTSASHVAQLEFKVGELGIWNIGDIRFQIQKVINFG